MRILSDALGYVMYFCYYLLHNYGLAIILFTLISKIVLLPVSVWVQKNSIKMVKMQPEINRIKAKHFGDADRIADEQSQIFKREKYNPLASLIPLAVQIILLMGLVAVMNGYEATKAIRRSPHELAKKIPIIAMTANAFSEDIQHSLAAGMNAHVSKPVEMKVLEKTIRSIKSGGGGTEPQVTEQ